MIKNLLAIYNKLDEPLKKHRLPRFVEILGCEQREEGCSRKLKTATSVVLASFRSST